MARRLNASCLLRSRVDHSGSLEDSAGKSVPDSHSDKADGKVSQLDQPVKRTGHEPQLCHAEHGHDQAPPKREEHEAETNAG
jgi:hypothetical protein